MTFNKAVELGIFEKIEKDYTPAIDNDIEKSFFKNHSEFITAYTDFINSLSTFLSQNNFLWEKEVRCFNRVYFSKTGEVDYFLFDFKPGQVDIQKEEQFEKLLNIFIKKTKIKIKSSKKFAQCSPIKYSDKKI